LSFLFVNSKLRLAWPAAPVRRVRSFLQKPHMARSHPAMRTATPALNRPRKCGCPDLPSARAFKAVTTSAFEEIALEVGLAPVGAFEAVQHLHIVVPDEQLLGCVREWSSGRALCISHRSSPRLPIVGVHLQGFSRNALAI